MLGCLVCKHYSPGSDRQVLPHLAMALKAKDSFANLRSSRGVRMTSAGDLSKHNSGHHGSFLDGNDETNALIEKLNNVKEELQITQESFISRERAYKIRIDELEEKLAQKRRQKIGWMEKDPKICALKTKQSQILSNVALVQDRFSRVVKEQEQDLLKAFQARLLDVQAELEMQKSKKDDGAVAYIELSKAKEYEVEKEKVKADLKERQNQALLQANNRLKSQFASREEDRNYLVMQINMARNDNTRLRTEFNDLEAENKKLKAQVTEQAERLTHANAASSASGGAANRKGLTSAQALQVKIDQEERFKEVNGRLRKLLAEERRALQQVRQNYNNEIGSRTELEMILRDCVDEVRQEAEQRKAEQAKYSTRKLQLLQEGEADPEQQRRDRERVLELMLSKEQVVSLIYAKSGLGTVPAGLSSPQKTVTAAGFGATGSPNAAMDGVINGLLDMNFGASPSWVSGSGSTHEGDTGSPHHLVPGGDADTNSASHRKESFMDKLPAIPGVTGIAPPPHK